MTETCTSKAEITEALHYAKSAHHRLDECKQRMDKLEENTQILHEMNTNIKLMIQQNQQQDRKIEHIEKDVNVIKEKDGKEYNKLKWLIVSILVTSVITFLITSWR